jgi:hypothetical protein
VKFDSKALEKQVGMKEAFMYLEALIEKTLIEGRAKSLVFTRLEEAYMWVGKAIRDEQILSRKSELQEQRANI